jgi:L-ascorbate metabolism protein UlaG (beta-lactamase superfamily)
MVSLSDDHKQSIPTPITFTWMGVAGLLFQAGDTVLAVDPFFTRPSIVDLLFKNLYPDRERIQKSIPKCDAIFVSHAHHDHLMDVSTVVAVTDAPVYASRNACRLLIEMGVAKEKIHPIKLGDQIRLKPFKVTVGAGTHVKLPLPLNGKLPKNIHHPPRFLDYKRDEVFSFLVHVEEIIMAIAPAAPVQSDLIFLYPYELGKIRELVKSIPPRTIVPIHWDNLFQPLRNPPQRPGVLPRLVISRFSRWLNRQAPAFDLIIPEYFRAYDARKVLKR